MSSIEVNKLNDFRRKIFILKQVKAIMSGEDYLLPLEEQKKLVTSYPENLTLKKGDTYGTSK